MRFFVRRRVFGAAATLVVLAAVGLMAERFEQGLYTSSFFTGWILLGSIAFLALFQIRKKLPAPPLGSSAAWLQAHIYVGLGSAAVYLFHTHGKWPEGALEIILAMLYVATFGSGVVGLYWTRTVPRRLGRVGEEVLYERIASLRGQLRDQAQMAILSTVRAAGATTLGQFYEARLHEYFSTRRGVRYRLFPTSTLRKSLMAELSEASRYLSDPEQKTAEELFSLVRKRDDLDFHEALQWRLKAWLFVHIALTYPLLLLAALHAWLAYLFAGRAA